MEDLDRTADALNRIDRTLFLKSFDAGQAVQHFYEPFLEAFDPQLRKEMGVWYTPPEIVRYMVERVDTILRTELAIADGLADKNVYILDPCCGTGAFVVEVLRRIEKTLRLKGDDPLIGQDIKEAALNRVFGFELMSAPFVIAHWQVGNLLVSLDAALDPSKGERPAIYLTNALTGWRPPSGPKATLSLFPELAAERDQAEHVKRDVPILVILGNPPYNAYAGTSPDEEEGLVDSYKSGLVTEWKIKKFNLDELYVRFLRVAERKIAQTGRGIIAYISSYSYISDQSFVVARRQLLKEFNRIWIDSLNGDSRETGKRTPSGDPDPSVFSTSYNRVGIRLGTAVGIFLRTDSSETAAQVLYRDFWGVTKREELSSSLGIVPFDEQYDSVAPQSWNKLSFRPREATPDYLSWPMLTELCAEVPINGLMEKRGGALIDINRDDLASRMKVYFDPKVDWEAFRLTGSSLAENAGRFEAKKARTKALKAEKYEQAHMVRYLVRPFDVRYAYYTSARPVWNEPRPQLWAQFRENVGFLLSRPMGVAKPEGSPVFFTRCLGDNDAQRGHSYYFPIRLYDAGKGMFKGGFSANLSKGARGYLASLEVDSPDDELFALECLWLHTLAIGNAPKYLRENADGLEAGWPRMPLPRQRDILDASAELGIKVRDILDSEKELPEVTSGTVLPGYRELGLLSSTDLSISRGWGSRDSLGKINPGRGHFQIRDWSAKEQLALKTLFGLHKVPEPRGFELVGKAVDVYLNSTTCWQAVPNSVWMYVNGGYQVIKKWLSYREHDVLGRPLTKEEAREVTGMIRRITALVLMTDALDANYALSKNDTYNWSSGH